MARVSAPASKAEKIILLIMGAILIVSLVLLYKKQTPNKSSNVDPRQSILSENGDEQ